MNKKYKRIDIYEYMNNGQTRYSCTVTGMSYEMYKYVRRNFPHHHRDAGERKIVVMANFAIERYQVDNVVNAYIQGKFEVEHTGDWE